MNSFRFLTVSFILLAFPMILQAADTVDGIRLKRKFGNVPGTLKVNIDKKDLAGTGATAAESTAILGKFASIEALFIKQPLVKKPVGYNTYVDTYAHPAVEPFTIGPKLPAPLSGYVRLKVSDFGQGAGGKMTETIVGAPIMIFYVNHFLPMFEGLKIYLFGPGSDMYYAPKKLGGYEGFTLYNESNNTYFATTSKNEPWTPVTQEEWILNLIVRIELQRDKEQSELAGKNLAPTDIVNNGKEERRKAFDQAYQMLKQQNPAEAEKAKKEFEEAEKKYAEEARVHPEQNSDELRAKIKKKYDVLIAEIKAELAAIPAKKRKDPALYVGERKGHPSGLGSLTDPNPRPVVRINYNFFHDGKPRQAVRCLTLRYNIRGVLRPESVDFKANPDVLESAVIIALHKAFDWKAVTALLDK